MEFIQVVVTLLLCLMIKKDCKADPSNLRFQLTPFSIIFDSVPNTKEARISDQTIKFIQKTLSTKINNKEMLPVPDDGILLVALSQQTIFLQFVEGLFFFSLFTFPLLFKFFCFVP